MCQLASLASVAADSSYGGVVFFIKSIALKLSKYYILQQYKTAERHVVFDSIAANCMFVNWPFCRLDFKNCQLNNITKIINMSRGWYNKETQMSDVRLSMRHMSAHSPAVWVSEHQEDTVWCLRRWLISVPRQSSSSIPTLEKCQINTKQNKFYSR